jgi:two-component system, chemotaxis family, protein-glutamate methylesterase/glutaminase
LTEKSILVIESTRSFSDALGDFFSEMNADFKIYQATSIADGIDLLDKNSIQLILSEHAGPGKFNGLELLRIIHKMDVAVQVILHAVAELEKDRRVALGLGCTNFLLSPYSVNRVCRLIFNMLQPSQGFSGRLVAMRLEDVIQMFCYRKDSTMLLIFSGGIWGTIYVHNGGIVHAECEDLSGVEAFYEILGWEKGEFLSQIVLEIPKQTLFMDWQSLLMEGMRQKDEIRHALEPVDGLQQLTPYDTNELSTVIKRIMVVDDSRFIRKIVFEILQSDPCIDVVGYATNGQEALEKIDELKPDLILLDWDMPVMKGSTTLMHIMIRSPCPVVILSGFAGGLGANPFDLLCLGGVDFLRKPQNNWRIDGRADDLVARIKEACKINFDKIRRIKIPQPINKSEIKRPEMPADSFIIFVTSTGGSADLIRIIPNIDPDWPTGILVLHDMQTEAIGAFTDYLDRRSHINVKSLQMKTPMLRNHVYIHPSSIPIEIVRESEHCLVSPAPHIASGESVNYFLTGAAHVLGSDAIAVTFSGEPEKCIPGLRFIKDLGGSVLAQDQSTSISPRLTEEVIREGLVDITIQPDNLVKILSRIVEGRN